MAALQRFGSVPPEITCQLVNSFRSCFVAGGNKLFGYLSAGSSLQFRKHTTGQQSSDQPIFDAKHFKRVSDTIKNRHSFSAAAAAAVISRHLNLPVSPGDVLNLTADQIHGILEATTNEPGTKNSELNDALFAHAESVSRRFFGDKVYQRGIVEFSNVCENDCGYCGIRKYQPNVHRYSMSKEEILDVAMKAFDLKMGTLMLQSGELKTPRRLSFVNDVVREIRRKTILADLMRKNDLTEALLTNQVFMHTSMQSIGQGFLDLRLVLTLDVWQREKV